MSDSAAIAGISVATLALIISLVCLIWILLHIGQRKNWIGSSYYKNFDLFKGGSSEYF